MDDILKELKDIKHTLKEIRDLIKDNQDRIIGLIKLNNYNSLVDPVVEIKRGWVSIDCMLDKLNGQKDDVPQCGSK